MTGAVRKTLIATISPTPYTVPLGITLVSPSPHRFFINVALPTGVALVGSGGAGPAYTYSITSGALPTGVSLNGSTGALTGTPTAQGVATFVAKVTDSGSNTFSHSLSMNVEAALQVLQGGGAPPSGTVGTAYRFAFLVADFAGSSAGVSYSVLSGSLPAGLSLSGAGVITGTPTAPAGTSTFTVRATKTSDGNLDIPCTMVVTARIVATVGFTIPTSLRNMSIGRYVSDKLQFGSSSTTYGLGSNIWSIASGALPAGLSLASDGTVSGIPTAATGSTYTQPTFTVTDAVTQAAATPLTTSGSNVFNVAVKISAVASGDNYFLQVNSDGSSDPVDFLALFFGFGADGDIVLDGTNTYPGIFTKGGSVYTPARHIRARNLSIVSPGSLLMQVYDMDVSDTLDLSNCSAGVIGSLSGINASGQTCGANLVTPNEVGASGAGVNGGAAILAPSSPSVPAAASDVSNGVPGVPYSGGHGGSGTVAGAAGGAGGQSQPWYADARLNPYDALFLPGSGVMQGAKAGGAGGAGGGTISQLGGVGGGSGGSPGVISIRCRRLKTNGSTAAGVINCVGGKGGDGHAAGGTNAGGGGGGSGGTGGRIRIIFEERIGTAVTNLIDASGGAGGAGGAGNGTGTAGGNGLGADSGIIEVIDVGASVAYYQGTVVASGSTAGAVNKMTI